MGRKSRENEATRVEGIPLDGQYHAEFQATEASITRCCAGSERVSVTDEQLVISPGDRYSVKLMDFNQPAAPEFAVKQLQILLKPPAFVNASRETDIAAESVSVEPAVWLGLARSSQRCKSTKDEQTTSGCV